MVGEEEKRFYNFETSHHHCHLRIPVAEESAESVENFVNILRLLITTVMKYDNS